MLHDARMAGLVKLRRSTGHLGERQQWAGRVGQNDAGQAGDAAARQPVRGHSVCQVLKLSFRDLPQKHRRGSLKIELHEKQIRLGSGWLSPSG